MKRLFITTILLGLLCACNSDDDSSENTTTAQSVLGKTYLRSGFVIDMPVDANGDGVFSTDLMQEDLCYDLILGFDEDLHVSNPTFDTVSLYVNDDGNGNLLQTMNCSHADGTANTYKQVDNSIEFYYGDVLQFTGTLSQDGNTITFTFPNELLFGFHLFQDSDRILQQNGTTVENYQGDAIVTYTLHE